MLDVTKRQAAPFDTARLDRLMDEAGIDVLIVTSKHNVQYLLGGHRAFFFESMDAMGLSRYLPVFVYAKGEPQKAGFFGHRMERFQNENTPFWVSELNTKSSGSVDVMEKAVDYARKLAPKAKRIGAELSFIPADATDVLRKAFPGAEIKDALFVLERLARAQDSGRAENAAHRLRCGDRFNGGGVQEQRPRRHQGGIDRGAAPRGNHARADLRLLPDHGRDRVSIARRPTSAGRRAAFCRSIPAAIITAISATSAAWASPASRTPNSSIFWPKSKRSSRPR